MPLSSNNAGLLKFIRRANALKLDAKLKNIRGAGIKSVYVGNVRDYIYRPGVYGFSGVQPAREAARQAENARIDRAVYEGIDRGIRPNIARSKLVNLIKKVRKKTGKTYYQRMQVARLQEAAQSAPLTAKKYIKGVDFSYSIYR